MTADDTKSSQDFGQESAVERHAALDLDFLATQTFGDRDLEREVLALFVAQARRLVADLPMLDPTQQADTAHLLTGSARGIGAWAAAEQAQRYEAAAADRRQAYWPALAQAVAAAAAAVDHRLAALEGDVTRM